MTTSSANYFMLRYAIALALIAPFAASDRAEADGCSPATPADNTTVTCTGTTTNQTTPTASAPAWKPASPSMSLPTRR